MELIHGSVSSTQSLPAVVMSLDRGGDLGIQEFRCPSGRGGSKSFPGAGGGAEERPLHECQSHRGRHGQEGAAGKGQGEGGGQAQAGPGQPAGGDQGNSEGKRGTGQAGITHLL